MPVSPQGSRREQPPPLASQPFTSSPEGLPASCQTEASIRLLATGLTDEAEPELPKPPRRPFHLGGLRDSLTGRTTLGEWSHRAE